MNKKQQNFTWACLPKETRHFIKCQLKAKSACPDYDDGYNQALYDIFGHHNLTSDTDPEEMLMVERKDAIDFYNKYVGNSTREISRLSLRKEINSLFGDKCLPDKEPSVQVDTFNIGDKVNIKGVPGYDVIAGINSDGYILENEPGVFYSYSDLELYIEHETEKTTDEVPNPFKKGDEVIIVRGYDIQFLNRKGVITYIDATDQATVKIGEWTCYLENASKCLERYTELQKSRCEICGANTQQCADSPCQNYKTNEYKELNLVEILQDCALSTPLFSISLGDVTLYEIRKDNPDKPIKICKKDEIGNTKAYIRDVKGKIHKDGLSDLYPSFELYAKYHLDSYSAWKEWQESRKPKRWRANVGEKYWRINATGESIIANEYYTSVDNDRYNFGNYFRTEEEADLAGEVVRNTFMEFHKNK